MTRMKNKLQNEEEKESPEADQTIKSVKLSDNIAPAFYPVHNAIRRKTHTQFWLKGGRGSTKTSFVAIEIIHGMMEDPAANAIALRKVGDTVRTSILESLLWAIETLGVSHLWSYTVSPAEITYKKTGQKILLKGLDKPIKLKSLRLKKGYFKFLWFEEVEEFNGMNEIRSVEQSVLRGGEVFVEFMTYNPPNEAQSWVNKEAEVPKEGRYVHHSTYLDVPRHWLGEFFISEAEFLKENNPLAYEHEYMGLAVGIHEAIIFSGKYRIATFEPQEEWYGPYFGLDWGFSQDPLALVKVWIEDVEYKGKERQKLYIERENFGKGIEIDDTPAFIEEIDGSKKYIIRADNARPEMISHLQLRDFNVVAADKWPGSVEDGIAVLKNFVEIVIHTRCKRMQEEARLYSYKIDKMTKEVTPDIIDKWNHGWDAVRYAIGLIIKERIMGYSKKQIKEVQKQAEKSTIAPSESEKAW